MLLAEIQNTVKAGHAAREIDNEAAAAYYRSAIQRLLEVLKDNFDEKYLLPRGNSIDHYAYYGDCVAEYARCNIIIFEESIHILSLRQREDLQIRYDETLNYLQQAKTLLQATIKRAFNSERFVLSEVTLPALIRNLKNCYAKIQWNIGVEYEIEARKAVKKSALGTVCKNFRLSVQYLRLGIELEENVSPSYNNALKAVERDLAKYEQLLTASKPKVVGKRKTPLFYQAASPKPKHDKDEDEQSTIVYTH